MLQDSNGLSIIDLWYNIVDFALQCREQIN